MNELVYRFHKAHNHIMWYMRAVYAPFNRLRVRNIGRRYVCDMDCYMVHAAFSVLCRHVERGYGGRAKLEESHKWRMSEADRPGQRSWGDAEGKMLALYDWYTQTDWKDPVPFPNGTEEENAAWADRDHRFHTYECNDKLRQLIEIRGYMWT